MNKHKVLQLFSLLVFAMVVLVFGDIMLTIDPSNTVVGHVVTAIEDLKESKQEQSWAVLAFTISLTVVLVLVYLYLRKYDVPMYSN